VLLEILDEIRRGYKHDENDMVRFETFYCKGDKYHKSGFVITKVKEIYLLTCIVSLVTH